MARQAKNPQEIPNEDKHLQELEDYGQEAIDAFKDACECVALLDELGF